MLCLENYGSVIPRKRTPILNTGSSDSVFLAGAIAVSFPCFPKPNPRRPPMPPAIGASFRIYFGISMLDIAFSRMSPNVCLWSIFFVLLPDGTSFFPFDEKMKQKNLVKVILLPASGFFLSGTRPGIPANAGPGYFDGLRCFRLTVKWGTWVKSFSVGFHFLVLKKSPDQVKIKTHRVVYKA